MKSLSLQFGLKWNHEYVYSQNQEPCASYIYVVLLIHGLVCYYGVSSDVGVAVHFYFK